MTKRAVELNDKARGTIKEVVENAWRGEALAELRKRNDVQWTYLSPAGDFVADGPRTGEYLLGGEEYFVNDKGESRISYADYAIAMVDEAEKGRHVQQRISVVAK